MASAATTDLIVCRTCGRRLTRPVERLPELPTPQRRSKDGYDCHPTMPQGRYAVDPQAIGVDDRGRPVSTLGCYVVNPVDAQGLDAHSDPGRSSGCCGHDGCDGPNRLCPWCGAEVATLLDDCWTVVEMRFEPDAVLVVRFYG